MSAIETLARQAAERDARLRDMTQRLEVDGRFVAAWLVGSLSEGSADQLSDIDLVVVIHDRHVETVLERPAQEVGRFGTTAWLKEIPGNAPPGGAYVSVGFQSSVLPIAVDWYWEPFHEAVLPSDSQLVFENQPVSRATPPASFAELMNRRSRPPRSQPGPAIPSDIDRCNFFWAMVPVAAKYSARGWDEKARHILAGLEEQVDILEGSGQTALTPAAATPPLRRLRLLMGRMNRLTPSLRGRGISIPDTSYAFAFMRLAEGLEEEGWQRHRDRSRQGISDR